MTKWIYLVIGILLVGVIIFHRYRVLQVVTASPSIAPSQVSQSSGGSLPSSGSLRVSQFQPPASQNTFPSGQGSGQVASASTSDQSVIEHTSTSGGREDIEQVGAINVSQPGAYTGDTLTFTVTLENQAPYKKFVKVLCFESTEGNFGCSPGFNVNPGQVFSISNNGRFTSSGVKYIWVTWSQDGVNFYRPLDAQTGQIRIF